MFTSQTMGSVLALSATPVFINEIHYDNAGTDLNGWTQLLYNGNGGVDSTDAADFRAQLGKCGNKPGFKREADYNASGCTDYADYRIWYAHYLAYLQRTAGFAGTERKLAESAVLGRR